MNHLTSRRSFAAYMFLLLAFASVACGEDKKDEDKEAAAAKYFTNTELVNQDGKKVRFYDDLLKGKTVVINGFFTTCNTICPAMTATLAKVQKGLGERVGKDVFFISISLDPTVDTPERLKAFGKKFEVGADWVFLTGSTENVEQVLKKLGLFTAEKGDHSPVLLIGNDTTGLWKKAYGLAGANELQKVITSVIEDKKEEKK